MNCAAEIKTKRKILAGIIGLFCTASASAATISPELVNAINSGSDVSYIVKFKDQADLSAFTGASAVSGKERRDMLRALRFQAMRSQNSVKEKLKNKVKKMTSLWSVNALSITSSADVINQVAADPDVESITLDATLTAPVHTLAATSPAEWNLNVTGATDLWNQGVTGTGVVVANMDTGVDMAHPDLRRRWRRGINSWFDPNGEHSSPYDAAGHGTQTMSIMVGGNASGNAIGMAPDAKWIAVKVFNDAGVATISSIHQGFQWLLDPDEDMNTDDAPDVVNGSWGFTELLGQCFTEFDHDIDLLRSAGINVSFASGNQGPAANTSVSPANNPSAYAVGAVDSSLNVASISGRGISACGGGLYPNVVAPGIDIRTADLTFGGIFPNSYAYISGTSAAAPHVAGAMALLKQAFPNASVREIESAIEQGALDVDVTGPDNNAGYGMVNVLRAHQILANGGAPVNTPPVAVSDSYAVTEGDVLNVPAPGILANDADADGDLLSVNEIPVSGPTGGQLTLFTDGSFVYTPDVGITADSFVYEISDGADTAQSTVNITVNPAVNNPPVAVNDNYTMVAGSTLIVSAPGVLSNDSDPDGDPVSLTTTPITGPLNGTLVMHADGGFEYTPDAGATSDSFTYEISDGLNTVQATVLITIESQTNSAPQAVVDAFTVTEGSTLDIAAPGLLSNDSDIDGDLLTVSISPVSGPTNGSLALNADGSFNYTPNSGATTDSFIYEISDGALTSQAQVDITVNPAAPQNTAPVAVADTATVARNSSDVFINLTGNDFDAENNLKDAGGNVAAGQIILSSNSTSRRGTVTVTQNGVNYTPRSRFRGTDTFSYTVVDQEGAVSNTVTVTVTVTR